MLIVCHPGPSVNGARRFPRFFQRLYGAKQGKQEETAHEEGKRMEELTSLAAAETFTQQGGLNFLYVLRPG